MNTIPRSALGRLSHLSDQDLLARLHLAAQAERRATAHLVALFIEIDSRRLYLREGFPSLFAYCTDALHLSEPAAYNRIEVARAARRFPIILDALAAGELTLSSIKLLAPHLTPENHADVLTRARHQSKRAVEVLVAALHPQPMCRRLSANCPRLVRRHRQRNDQRNGFRLRTRTRHSRLSRRAQCAPGRGRRSCGDL